MNSFLTAVRQHDTYTENGAVSHSTSGDSFLDYFSKAGTYRDRAQSDVDADISRLWAESPIMTLQMLFYLRMVTRKTRGFREETDTVQKGQGARDEFRKGISWVARYHGDILNKNLWLIPVVGCWKDIWHPTLIDVLDERAVIELIKQGLESKTHRDLLAKYLPKIRSSSNTHNDRHKRLNRFARTLCSALGWTERHYRKFKSSGKAHTFQRAMSQGKWNQLDFSKISGKALFNLVTSKGRDDKLTVIQRHGLEDKYIQWIKNQPTAKFTGYVYELGSKVKPYQNLPLAEKITIDKQFDGLIELAKQDEGGLKGNIWCALDTSGSMGHPPVAKGITPYDVCVSLGIFFSTLNEGAFKDHVVMFDETSKTLKLKGSFVDKMKQIQKTFAFGGTNFQSVIDEIVRVRKKNLKIPVEDYPQTLLVVSDMQFNDTQTPETNYEMAMRKLREVGLPDIQIIWWQVTGRTQDVPSLSTDAGVVMLSGFDGSVLSLILGGEQVTIDASTGEKRKLNPYEQMLKALNQQILKKVRV
jgi:hypothetical protein